jgi:hypothetical protein
MKTTTQFLLGMITCLLLTSGFVRAAGHFDPVTPQAAPASHGSEKSAPDCTGPCSLA